MPAGHLASMFNAQGPNANCLTACAASSQAIGEAVEIIRRGDADVMLSGGTHSMIHPFGVTGFNLLTALSHAQRRAAPRPRGRSTATATASCWAKAPAMVVLEELEHAKRRGAHDLRRGRRLRLDGRRLPHHRHAPRRPRRHRAACSMALDDAGLNPERHRLHQRPRHQHRGQRQGRDAGHQEGLRRAGLQDARLQHQEHDGPPDRRRRRDRADRLPAGDPRQRPAADDQLRELPTPTATWTTSPTRPAKPRATTR